QFAGLLNAAQRRDDRIEQKQKEVSAVVIEKQLPVAGAVALRADVMQALQERHQPVEVLQTDDVAVANLAGFARGHTATNAQTPCRAQEENTRKSRIFAKKSVAQISCRTGLGHRTLFRSFVAVEIDPGAPFLHADKPPAMARRVEVRLPAIKAAAAHHGHSRAQGPEVPFDPVAEGVVLEVHPRQEGAAVGGA